MKRTTILLCSFILICAIPALACGGSVIEPDTGQINASEKPEQGGGLLIAPNMPYTPNQTWLVMLYQNADDEILEKDIFTDLNEAEIAGSTDQVTIVSQLDRYKGAFKGDGNWKTAKRFLVTKGYDLEHIESQELSDMGELDSGNWYTLADFGIWAVQTYPADRYVLILSDHGAGWEGGWSDDTPVEGSSFTTNDIDSALAEILNRTGIDMFEMVGFDACLMSQVETMDAVAPYARYAVASEETEPALGWAYASFLEDLTSNPGMSGSDLAKSIVASYVEQDFRITDDNARKALLEEFGEQSTMSASQVAQELSVDTTLTAIDLSAMRNLNAALNNLAYALSSADQKGIAKARSYSQSYESVFGDDVPPSYIDLGHFASMLIDRLGDDPNIMQAVDSLRQAINQAVIAEKHGPDRPGSTGFSIFFPNSLVYGWVTDPSQPINYTAYASRFAAASLWDDFLLYHYTSSEFSPQSANLDLLNPVAGVPQDMQQMAAEGAIPGTSASISAPGQGVISIEPITLSANEISVDGTVTLSTLISGDNIGYIYFYASYYDEQSGSFLSADMDYIGAENTREVSGIYYPEWGVDELNPLDVDWDPTVYFMGDGVNEEFALFTPTVYGSKPEDDVYTVNGIYTFADGGEQRDAIIEFGGDFVMRRILGFTGSGGTGASREITPQLGDTFTITEEWLDFDQNPAGEFVNYEGGTMTYSGIPFTMVPYYAYSGTYLIGILVEDLNGNTIEEYAQLDVTE